MTYIFIFLLSAAVVMNAQDAPPEPLSKEQVHLQSVDRVKNIIIKEKK